MKSEKAEIIITRAGHEIIDALISYICRTLALSCNTQWRTISYYIVVSMLDSIADMVDFLN